jgi:DNA invertase Pin-like site-specific DNA recombinase
MSDPKNVISQIRKATRRKFTAEEKIRIVLEAIRGEIPISDICRREGIAASQYYKWSKEFLEAGKNGLITYTIFRTLLIGRCDMPVKTKEKALCLVDGILYTKQLTI